jgi:hypothetical protein
MATEPWSAKWRKLRELGKGGQGTTYEVVTDSNERGVLKLLRDGIDEQARARMVHEALNLERLAKAGVKVPRKIEDNTEQYKDLSIELYLVMEFIEGKTLDKVVADNGRRLSLDRSVAIARDLCATMKRMHELEVMHRDVKPANLMVRDLDKADVVVLDLGLSFDQGRDQETVTTPHETIKNELLVLPGSRREFRNDITNVVAVFFYCLTGQLAGQLRDRDILPPHQRKGLTMAEVLAGDRRAQQVEMLLDTGFAAINDSYQTVDELDARLALILNLKATKKDPVQLDLELGEKLQRSDRNFQLQSYQARVSEIGGHIAQYAQGLANKLKTYSITLGGSEPEVPLPSGIDLVHPLGAPVVVGVRTRPQTRTIKFCVGAKGEQCVLLACCVTIEGRKLLRKPEWKEVAWFDPSKPPDQKTVADWIELTVTDAMEEFRND